MIKSTIIKTLVISKLQKSLKKRRRSPALQALLLGGKSKAFRVKTELEAARGASPNAKQSLRRLWVKVKKTPWMLRNSIRWRKKVYEWG